MKTYIGLLIIVLIIIGGFVYTQKDAPSAEEEFSVVTSFYPLYYFASEVGGEYVAVHNITPAGAEPHEYEPTPRDMIMIENSDLVFINGGGLEPWEHDILEEGGIHAHAVGEPLMTLAGEEHHHDEEEEDEHEEHEHDEEEILDPHVWLSPRNAISMVEAIRDAFIDTDPEHGATYRTNAAALIETLTTLDEDYQNALAVCTSRTIVTAHAAFGYLADAYELEQLPINGLSPEVEPSPARMAEIAEFAREENVTHIFFETLVSPRLAETIAQEIGAETLVLNPLEGLTEGELRDGETYVTIMYANLDNLVRGLSCTL